MPQYLNNINLSKNELQNARVQNLASAPGSPVSGQVYYDTTLTKLRWYNGSAWVNADENTVIAVNGTAPIQVAGTTTRTVSIDAASGSTAGSMSIAHYNLVAGATSANTPSTIVLRDGSGNFTAGTITAALTGTASNAALLNNQNAAFYQARANHTGTQTASTISDFDTQVRTSRLDQMAVPTVDVSFNSKKIINLLDPTNPQDAATKNYVDAARSGLDVKQSVRVASTANVSVTYAATGGTSARGQITAVTNTIDGVSLATNDRVLLKDQSTAAQNGIWSVTTVGTGANGVWDRATDFDQDAEVTSGAFVFVAEGTVNDNSGWVLTTNDPIVIGGGSGTNLAFAQFSGAGQITAGAGLTKTGNTLDVGAGTGITVNADTIQISASYVGQASITTLGTITTGVWNGTTIAVANGGSGRTSTTAYMPIVGGTTSTGAEQSVAAGSTTGQALTYQGASAVPAFAAINLAGGSNIVTGLLPVGNGGSGAGSFTTNGVLLGNSTSAFNVTAAGSAYQPLRVPSGGGAPVFGAIDISQSAAVTGILAIANGGTNATSANYTTSKFMIYDGTRILSSAYDQTSFATAGHTHGGSTAKYATAIGDGSTVNFTVTHNLGSQDVVVEVAEAGTPWAKVYPDIEHTSTTTVTVRFAVAPTSNQYRVTVVG